MNIAQNATNSKRSPLWEDFRQTLKVPTPTISKRAPPGELTLAENIDRLVAIGFGPFLRPCPPPAAQCWFTSPRTKQPERRPSDGKVPGQFRNGEWYGWRGWRQYEPTAADFAEWRNWPDAGLCLVTGEVAAFDIDIKIDDGDRSTGAEQARKLVAEIKATVAAALGVSVDALPLRSRPGTTSCGIFARASKLTTKRKLEFASAHGPAYAVEFLADGQQVVIAGRHATGARLQSALVQTPLARLPMLEAGRVDDLMAEIGRVADRLGFHALSAAQSTSRSDSSQPSPDRVVLREVLARRDDWLPSVLPVSANNDPELRIPSSVLGRDLEEDLAIYRDGIFDHGTERMHTPSSLIAEVGAIDESGEITFGGCPDYGQLGRSAYAVVGEPDPTVRRPTEAQALTWLCRTLSGRADFPSLPDGSTWRDARPMVAKALGLNFDNLTTARWFDFEATGEDPTKWNAVSAAANGNYLAALQAIDGERFDRLAFALDIAGVDAVAIAKARREAVVEMAVLGEPDAEQVDTASNDAMGEFPEPFDIFGHDDVGELGALLPNCLHPMMKRWVTSEARRKGVPEAFAAASALGVAASAIGASRRIQVRSLDTDYTQPASLWIMLVADPGSAKSPIISAAVKPLQQIEDEWMEVDLHHHSVWSALAPKKRNEPDTRGPEPKIRRLLVDDITTEQQVRIHAHNPRGIIRSTDEIESFFGSFGAYKKNGDGDRTLMLRLFSGDTVKVDRVGSGVKGVKAKHGLMAVLGGTQPAKLRTRMRELSDDGMLQRFIPVLHDGVDRHRVNESPDGEAAGAYALALRLLTSVEMQSTPVRLGVDAQNLLDREVLQIAALKHVPGAPLAWRGHVEKWEMLLARIVLTLHQLDQAYSGKIDSGALVTLETTRRAVRLARFLLRHALHFYLTFFEHDRTADDAQVIAGFILTNPDVIRITPRTVGEWRKDLRGAQERRRLLNAMAELVSAGWLRVVEQGATGSMKWEVNPAVHARFVEHAQREVREHRARRDAILGAGAARKALFADEMSESEA